MSGRRFNYTDRRRLLHADTLILLQQEGSQGRFAADIRLKDYELPANAKVFVEAYRRTFLQRFDFGIAADPQAKSDCVIAGTNELAALLFRVKVVGENGMILAEGDRIAPDDLAPDSRKSFLHVREDDLSGELWALEFEDNSPILVIERRYGPKEMLIGSPYFQWLVLPTILREMLRHVLTEEVDDESFQEVEGSWLFSLLRMATNHARSARPADPEHYESWIDNAVRGFCRDRKFPHKFGSAIFGGENS